MTSERQHERRAFSLIEVVIATAVFATAIVAIIGLMSPLSRRVEDVIDSETASRLAESIQSELNRIGFSDAITVTTAGEPLVLVANERGDRVRIAVLASGTPAADNDLVAGDPPGIANRSRYFRITLARQVAYDPINSGSLALRALVEWPYQVPIGPASNTTDPTVDDFKPTEADSRQSISFFFALTP